MSKVSDLSARKSDHLRINLNEDVSSSLTTGLERYHFNHNSLPEIDLDDVDPSQLVFKHHLSIPLLISSMTGGTVQAQSINLMLARAAQKFGLAMGLGSMRAALENPDSAATFKVRQAAPDILLFANLGAVQLNYGVSISDCQRIVELAGSDALVLHLNPLQEALQPEGNARFAGLLAKIENVCKGLAVPVIVKEVGWGINSVIARRLVEAGVSCIDVAGAGGTSWSQVEMHRASDESQRRLAAAFVDWGIPTSQAILNVRQAAPELLVFASGGLRNGVEIAKCLALGASLGGMAGPYLKAAVAGVDVAIQTIQEIRREIQVCMFGCGAGDLGTLRQGKLEIIP